MTTTNTSQTYPLPDQLELKLDALCRDWDGLRDYVVNEVTLPKPLAGHVPIGAKPSDELTFDMDHSLGTGHASNRCRVSRLYKSNPNTADPEMDQYAFAGKPGLRSQIEQAGRAPIFGNEQWFGLARRWCKPTHPNHHPTVGAEGKVGDGHGTRK